MVRSRGMERGGRRLKGLGPALLLGFGGLYALASINCCGPWGKEPDRLLASASSEASAPLLVGAARVPLEPPLPAVRAGYAPPRPELDAVAVPLSARALVIRQGSVSLALVSLDLLLVPAPLRDRIAAAVATLGFSSLWVAATHTHASFGGFDRRPLAVLAGTGRFDPNIEQLLAEAAVRALETAHRRAAPALVQVADVDIHNLLYSRSDDGDVDGAVTALRFSAPNGAAIAEWLIAAAHPTLVPREAKAFDTDYPGRLAALRETEGSAPVVVVTQGAGGNAAAITEGAEPPDASAHFAKLLDGRVDGIAWPTASTASLAFADALVALPRPDSTRVAPFGVRALVDNTMCLRAEKTARVSLWRIGPTALLAIPGEPTHLAAVELLAAARAARVVGLANGYIGYIEPRQRVERNEGEARRQYFRPELLERFVSGAKLASSSLK